MRQCPSGGLSFASFALSISLLVSVAPLAHAECPPSEMHFSGGVAVLSTETMFDSTYAPPGYVGHFRAAYDLLTGSLDLYHCCSFGVTSVTTHDAYDVEGVPAGTPVAVIAEMVVDGAVFTNSGCGGSGCGGTFASVMRHGAEFDESRIDPIIYEPGGRQELHDTLQLPITIVSGQPEEIQFELWGRRAPGGSHGAEGTGRIRFIVQEPGVRVISCQGFGGLPVPTRSSTWGRLKTIYR